MTEIDENGNGLGPTASWVVADLSGVALDGIVYLDEKLDDPPAGYCCGDRWPHVRRTQVTDLMARLPCAPAKTVDELAPVETCPELPVEAIWAG